jgi:hypothetical protein
MGATVLGFLPKAFFDLRSRERCGSEGASGTRSRPSPTRLLREIPSTNSVQLVEIIISELLDTALRDSAGF